MDVIGLQELCHSRSNLALEIVHDHPHRDVITEGSSCRLDVGADYLST